MPRKECNSCTNKPRKECPNDYCIDHCSMTDEHEIKFTTTDYLESNY